MPKFREKLLNKLRSVEQGADTMIWLCCYKDLEKLERGAFFQDRKPVSKHLPLACSRNSTDDENDLMKKLDDYYDELIKQLEELEDNLVYKEEEIKNQQEENKEINYN